MGACKPKIYKPEKTSSGKWTVDLCYIESRSYDTYVFDSKEDAEDFYNDVKKEEK